MCILLNSENRRATPLPLVRTSHQQLLEPGEKLCPQAHRKFSICSTLGTTVSDMFINMVNHTFCDVHWIYIKTVSVLCLWHSFVKCVSLAVYCVHIAIGVLASINETHFTIYRSVYNIDNSRASAKACGFTAAQEEL